VNGLIDPDTVIFLAAGISILGYLATSQIILRHLILAGSAMYIYYYFAATEDPLWTAIIASGLQAAANIVGLSLLFVGRSQWAIPAAHRDLYPPFTHIPPGDFAALVRRATRVTVSSSLQLTEEGKPVENLYYVISGGVEITKGHERFDMPDGMFVGEVSLMLGQPASSSACLKPGSEVLVWSSKTLSRQVSRRPQLKLTLDAAIARDMAAKVARAVAAERDTAPSSAATS